MSRSAANPREIAVPVSVFASLRSEVEKETGVLTAVRALHNAGYHAGMAAATTVNKESGGDTFAMGQGKFWTRLSEFFSKRGWGTLDHRAAHPGVGILSSMDWAEATTDEPNTGCSFSAGFLSGLLSQLAGGPIAVLEVECRTRGQDSCAFAFGSETTIHDLYGRLLEGADLENALATL